MKQWFLFSILWVSLFASAQQPLTFQHIDERQGLNSSKIIRFYTDSRGLLWVGCLDGLYTFDGHQCTNFSTEYPVLRNHLTTGVAGIVEDKNGNIWISINDGMLCYHRATGKISYHTFYFDKEHQGKNFCNPFYVDNKNRLWVFICDPSSLSVIDLNDPKLRRDTITSLGNGFCQTSNNKLFEPIRMIVGDLWYGFGIMRFHEDGILSDTEVQMNKDKEGKPTKTQVHRFYFLSDSILYLATSDGLMKYNQKTHQSISFTDFEGEKIKKLNCIKADGEILYVASQDNGLLLFDLKKEKYVAQYLHDATNPFSISGNEVNTIYIDENKNIFLGINGTGLDYCNLHDSRLSSQYNTNLPEKKKQAISFLSFSSYSSALILAGSSQKGLLLLDTNKEVIQSWNKSNSAIPSNTVTALFRASPTSTIVGTDNGLSVFNHSSKSFSSITPDAKAKIFYSEPYINFISRISNTEIGICTPSGFFIILSDLKTLISLDTLNQDLYTNYASFYAITSDSLLVNTWESYCYLLTRQEGKWSIRKKIENFATVFDYLPIHHSQFWIATSKGLQQLDVENGSYIDIPFSLDARCYSVTQRDGFFWISSNKGLIKYAPITKQFKLYDERSNTINKGFLPHAFLAVNNEIILGGEKGLNFFKPKNLSVYTQPLKPWLNSILINDVKFDFDSNINETQSFTFPYSQNTVSFQYSTINYSYTGASYMRYFLEGYDKNPVKTASFGNVRYARLPAGDYSFHLQSFSDDAPNYIVEKIIKIHITPPFYQTWWFRLLAISMVAGLVYAVFRYRVNQIREEEKQKTAYSISLAEMESRALRSQMNPHFIFNSLNAIQRYIFQNDVEKSATYLTRFARLMRQILENSKVPFITLQEEISSLETYIELEKMRFENKFQSTISIADDIEFEHTLVPPLLLQPYVENAIWHGLMHKDSLGLLKISILLKQGNLVMQIEDNGIGRKAAALLKSKPQNHNSTALKATEERLLLIERTTGKKVAVEIIDLENEKGEPFGTKVVLTMPLLED